jgi:transposase
MRKVNRREFTPEFKAEAVALVKQTGRSVVQVAGELGISDKSLWNWVHRASVENSSKESTEPLTPAERDELKRLRKEIAVLREEREILKKATAFFAKQSV